jgi:8-amino-7-oxononanoate synthase
MSVSPWHERFNMLVDQGLDRRMRIIASPVGPSVETPDGPKLLFCSNDYLGLAADPRIGDALARSAKKWGSGTAASRLISGNTSSHSELERRLALFMGTQAAVLFPSGFQANVGALPALVGEGDVIFSDELCHASLIDGSRLSYASVRIFRHADARHLEHLLEEEPPTAGIRLVVTDAIFSMSGDLAPIEDICSVADRHGARIYLDEAHSLGVIGTGGRGLAEDKGLADRTAIRIGTLGKAFGVAGAFVACDSDAAGILVSRARSLLYTTGPPVPLVEALIESLKIVEGANDLRTRLAANISLFKDLAHEAGVSLTPSDTPIQPVPIGPADRAMAVSVSLWNMGFFVQGIRPPTVAAGTSRLRVTLCASHTRQQIENFVGALATALAPETENK